MRGTLSNKLTGFIEQVNQAAAEFKQSGAVLTPEQARINLAKLDGLVSCRPKVSQVINLVLNSADGDIPTRIYLPENCEGKNVLIYFHGGGHMCGSVELYDPMCSKLCLATDSIVISVDYRLAPEFPYPAGLNDAHNVVKNYRTLLADINIGNELYIAGDSAGGAICSSLMMLYPELNVTKQVLIYPSLDYTCSSDSIAENGSGYLLETPRIQWYFDHYFQNNEDRKACSPLFGSLPNSKVSNLVITAGCDPLRDEGLAYVSRLKQAGQKVSHYQFDNMIHAFINIEDLVKEECELLYQTIGKFIKDEN